MCFKFAGVPVSYDNGASALKITNNGADVPLRQHNGTGARTLQTCHKWVYDTSTFKTTVVSQVNYKLCHHHHHYRRRRHKIEKLKIALY